MASEMPIMLLSQRTGTSEVFEVSSNSTVAEVIELAKALLGESGDNLSLLLNGRPLTPVSSTMQQVGVNSGDLLLVQPTQAPKPPAAPSGGLDFSNLLAGTAPAPQASGPRPPVYYPNMSVNEAIAHNPHPEVIVKLLQDKEHLFKELRYYNPKLAADLQAAGPNAVQVWRQSMVKGSIERAIQKTETFHQEKTMKDRLASNPDDEEAKAYFRKQNNKELIDQQYRHVMEQYPEAFSKVLMLYVSAKINGHEVQAFCDSGAQMTIISKRLASECGLLDMVDERQAGIAQGVGTSKIMGRIHLVQMEFQMDGKKYYFPCTITVMDDPPPGAKEMPFLLGLDMMKRHQCQLDLGDSVLRFRLDGSEYLSVPFLHEKDLSEEQGGTRGFDAAQSNAKLMKEDGDEDI